MSFGKWYEEQQHATTADGGGSGSGSNSSWFGSSAGGDHTMESLLPQFSTESLNSNLQSMRSSMEAQMPQKIMGMGYQQRFKVRKQKKQKTESHYAVVIHLVFDTGSIVVLCMLRRIYSVQEPSLIILLPILTRR